MIYSFKVFTLRDLKVSKVLNHAIKFFGQSSFSEKEEGKKYHVIDTSSLK